VPRPSFFQLDNVRKARRRGDPQHLIVHEDVLVSRGAGRRAFRAPGRQAAAEPGSLAT